MFKFKVVISNETNEPSYTSFIATVWVIFPGITLSFVPNHET